MMGGRSAARVHIGGTPFVHPADGAGAILADGDDPSRVGAHHLGPDMRTTVLDEDLFWETARTAGQVALGLGVERGWQSSIECCGPRRPDQGTYFWRYVITTLPAAPRSNDARATP